MTTPRDVIDAARSRHWTFADAKAGDGAALLYLNHRLRTHLSKYGPDIEGLVGQSVSYDLATLGGILIAKLAGVPVYSTTYQDGWALHLSAGGTPYVDFSEAPIAGDPFGQNGGTPGFPLPGDLIRLIAVVLTLNDPAGIQVPCDVIKESGRLQWFPGRNPAAFVSGNRLVPLMRYTPDSLNTASRWFSVSAIAISYVAGQTLTTLDDVLNLPGVLTEALVADLSCWFAYQSRAMPQADKVAFATEAARCGALLEAGALDVLNDAEEDHVIYRG